MRVSICIANYKQDQFLPEALASCDMQDYPNKEIVIYHDTEGVGSGEAFNRAIAKAKGNIIVLMCADDVFTDPHVISDIVKEFENPTIGHVSRYYHQFIDGDRRPVRAWRGGGILELANNPSGLAFRRYAVENPMGGYYKLTNKMFIEAPMFVKAIINDGWSYSILKYDTIGVRIHKSTARSKDYYKKMWTGSVVKEWGKLGWNTKDFSHLIQVKNYFTMQGVWNEIMEFIKLDPSNLVHPLFWFYSLVALCVPRWILIKIPDIYRSTYGRMTTLEAFREK